MPIQNQLETLFSSEADRAKLVGLRHIAIEPTLAGAAMDCVNAAGVPLRHVTLVADANTYGVLGQRIESEVSPQLQVHKIVLEGNPVADMTHVAQAEEACRGSDLVVAVGSGTVNDICKYASLLAGKPYVSFPTAPSMNGYTSANASITKAGHKHSFAAHLPAGIFCDMDVVAKAPQRLISAGFADVMCRSTAQADWLLSHLLLGTAYNEQPFAMLKSIEGKLSKKAAKIATADVAAVRLLMEALLISGAGMVVAGGSYSASQGEHLIAHCMEMTLPRDAKVSYHGEQIAVTTLTMLALQEKLLTYVPALLKSKTGEGEIEFYFPPSLRESISKEYEKKKLSPEKLDLINKQIIGRWQSIVHKLNPVRVPEKKLRTWLEAAGCPTKPEDLGWKTHDYEKAVAHAHFIRDRFTFLDVDYLSR